MYIFRYTSYSHDAYVIFLIFQMNNSYVEVAFLEKSQQFNKAPHFILIQQIVSVLY